MAAAICKVEKERGINMEKRQIWNEDIGQSIKELTMVLSDYQAEGIRGLESRYELENYIKGLSNAATMQMYAIDADTALHLMADVCGLKNAVKSYMEAIMYEEVKEDFIKTLNTVWEDLMEEAESAMEKIRNKGNYSILYKVDRVVKSLEEEARQEDMPIYEGDRETDSYIRLSKVMEIVKEGIHNK